MVRKYQHFPELLNERVFRLLNWRNFQRHTPTSIEEQVTPKRQLLRIWMKRLHEGTYDQEQANHSMTPISMWMTFMKNLLCGQMKAKG